MFIEKKDDSRALIHEFNFPTEADKDIFLSNNPTFSEVIGELPYSVNFKYKFNDANVVVADDEWNAIEDDIRIRNNSIEKLKASDWRVIKELEQLHLNGTPINIERTLLRQLTDVRDYQGVNIFNPSDEESTPGQE